MLIVGSSPLSDLGTQSLLLLKLPKHFDIILNLTCLMYLPSRTTVSSRGVFAHLENRLLILFFHLPTMSFCQDHYCSQWCGRPRRCNPKVFPKMSTQMRRAWTWSNDSSFRWWPFQTTKELLTLPLHRRNSTISLCCLKCLPRTRGWGWRNMLFVRARHFTLSRMKSYASFPNRRARGLKSLRCSADRENRRGLM